ncbi:hypothetical protein BV898_08618 [Hypsibius exemplaris]|uniref:CUB domain-containing protein n=1 Tax=Hypsibius exemplaris TaxID=2072580 RepID=A0A1W0WPS8_HYPEX|nr:hypothetical protein BV898_08618 [Hypsibius exemplaris]
MFGGLSGLSLSVFLLVSLCVEKFQAFDYPITYLDGLCGNTISLPCRKGSSGTDRGGTWKFHAYPKAACAVTFTVDGTHYTCDTNARSFAIYFNVRSLDLDSGDRITVNETYSNGSTMMVKYLPGGPLNVSDTTPRSMAQLVTVYSERPTLTVNFHVSGQYPSTTDPVTFDFNVLNEFNQTTDSLCPSLKGYVNNDLICDMGDRINCPSFYVDIVGLNPAKGVDRTQAICAAPISARNSIGILLTALTFAVWMSS